MFVDHQADDEKHEEDEKAPAPKTGGRGGVAARGRGARGRGAAKVATPRPEKPKSDGPAKEKKPIQREIDVAAKEGV